MSPPHDVDARPDWELASSCTAADDESDHAAVYLGEPIRSGYVLIPRAHLANVTSLEHER